MFLDTQDVIQWVLPVVLLFVFLGIVIAVEAGFYDD